MRQNYEPRRNSLVSQYMGNIRDMFATLKNDDGNDLARMGFNKIIQGNPLWIADSDLPIICISLGNISNETAGVGHQGRRDAIYTFEVILMFSELQSEFDYTEFYDVCDQVYDYFTLHASQIVYNVNTGDKVGDGLMPEIGPIMTGHEKRFVGNQTAAMLVSAKFTIEIQKHKNRHLGSGRARGR